MSWRVEVAASAERDFDAILEWTLETFGPSQARIYESALLDLIEASSTGPSHHAFRARPTLGAGVFTLHLRDCGFRGRHLLLIRLLDSEARRLAILRILHDRMNLAL